VSARVGNVIAKDGDKISVGQPVMELDGRVAVAVAGDSSFYRSLDVGDRGPDVRQLNQVLADAGYDPGPVTDSYTERTRTALGKWQAAQKYPSAATAKSQTLTMSLAQGSGYKSGPRNTAAVVVAGASGSSAASGTTRTIAYRPGDATVAIPAGPGFVTAAGPVLTISGTQTIADGDTATLTVEAGAAFTVDTQVTLNVSGDLVAWQDYVPFEPILVFPAGASTATVTVRTLPRTTISHDKRLVVSIAPSGAGAYSVSPIGAAVVTVRGAAGPEAVPTIILTSATGRVTKGQPFPLTLTLSQATTDRIVARLEFGGSAVAGADYVVASSEVAIPAGQTSGAVQIPTVTDKVVKPDTVLTVSLAADPAYVVGSPSAASTIIESTNVPELSLETATATVDAGGNVTFVVTADQPLVKDTSVNFQFGGSAVAGQDYKVVPGTVVLRAGESSFTVVVTTIRRDVVFKPGDMIVGTWPTRIGQVLVKQDQSVSPGTPLLSLTETGSTVKLTASASDRTKLKVGQKVLAKIAGGGKQVSGTISQLDDSVTVDAKTGAQSYGGKVDTADLGGADGANVSIEVILNERPDAIVVPIASVKQDGKGNDVVRVIDLAGDGKVTEVRVTTGITEGSYTEIVSGLTGGEVIVVETSPPAGGTSSGSGSSSTSPTTTRASGSGSNAPATTAAK
jgi:hypothetical protein